MGERKVSLVDLMNRLIRMFAITATRKAKERGKERARERE
jgi:hypothetical protein